MSMKRSQNLGVNMVSKLFERSSLGSALLMSASVLDPDVLQGSNRDKLITRFKTLLKVVKNLVFQQQIPVMKCYLTLNAS